MNIHTVIQTKLFISKGTLSCFVLFFLLELVVFWEKKKKCHYNYYFEYC